MYSESSRQKRVNDLAETYTHFSSTEQRYEFIKKIQNNGYQLREGLLVDIKKQSDYETYPYFGISVDRSFTLTKKPDINGRVVSNKMMLKLLLSFQRYTIYGEKVNVSICQNK